MSREDPQFKLRWPVELKDKVSESAKAYGRSMNADIVARLEQSFALESDFSPLNMPPHVLANRLKEIAAKRNEENQELYVETGIESEKDKKIDQLEKQLANSMKMMGVITGMFESILEGNSDEYMEKIFKKYPNVKKLYKESNNIE